MLKKAVVIFGVILLILGILGFVPRETPEGYLFGVFHVNPAHNWLHILTGIIAIFCGKCDVASRRFFQIFGVIYAIIAILGFFHGNHPIFGILANNQADNVLHVIIAIIALYLGFGCCKSCCKSECHEDMCKKPQNGHSNELK